MKQYETETAGKKLVFNGPSTVEEYEAKGGVGSLLEEGIANLIARDTLPDFQSKLRVKLESLFQIPRTVDAKKTETAKARAKDEAAKANVKDVLESDLPYIRRVMATIATDPDKQKQFDAVWSEVEATVEVDPTPSKRQSRGPGKEYVERAETFLALPTDQLEAKITKIAELVPNVEETLVRDADGKPNVQSLAFAIKAWRDERDKQDGMSV